MDKNKLMPIIIALVVAVGLSFAASAMTRNAEEIQKPQQFVAEGQRGGPPGQEMMGPQQGPAGPPQPQQMMPGRGAVAGGASEEQVKEFLAFLKEDNPEKYKELMEMKDLKPQLYRRVLFEGIQHYRHMQMLKKEDPEKYKLMKKEMELDQQMRKLSRQYREAESSAVQAQVKKKLMDVLNKLFDIRTRHREEEIEELKSQVEKLSNLMKKRENNKKLIVERKFNEITGANEGLEW